MPVVVEESPPVGRGVEIALNWAEAPRGGGYRRFWRGSAVETWMELHAAPNAECRAARHLRECGSLRPEPKLGDRDQFRFAVDQFSIVRERACRTGIDRYMWFVEIGIKATPKVRPAALTSPQKRVRRCICRRHRRTPTAWC